MNDQARRTLLSIPSLHEHLVENFPNPPSQITLKRWSASGRLKLAEVVSIKKRSESSEAGSTDGGRSRPRYDRDKAVQIIREYWDLSTPTAQQPEPGAQMLMAPPGMEADLRAILERMAVQLEANTKAIAGMVTTLTAVAGTISQLNSVRNSLMMKYDATSAQQSQIIEFLRQKIAGLEDTNTLSRDVQSLRQSVNRLAEQIRPSN